jgi:GNAT superfamily N-acetyltransferase
VKVGDTRNIDDLRIVPAEIARADAVARVYASAWPGSVRHRATAAVREELLKIRGARFWEGEIRRLESRRSQFLVAEHHTEIVGFAASASEPDGGWELIWLFVTPESQGRGVGKRLHQEIVAGSAGARPSERFLWVVPGNRRAERFYADRGWRPSTSTKYVETPAGAFPLQKWILRM